MAKTKHTTASKPQPTEQEIRAFNTFVRACNTFVDEMEDAVYYANNPAAEAEVNRQIRASKRVKL